MKKLFYLILVLHLYTSCMEQEESVGQKRQNSGEMGELSPNKYQKLIEEPDRFSALPQELKEEIFKIILKDLLQECMENLAKDRTEQNSIHKEICNNFFEQLGNLALVNTEFYEFIRKYIPFDQNRGYLKFYSGDSLLAMAVQNGWRELQNFILSSFDFSPKSKFEDELAFALDFAVFMQNDELINKIKKMGLKPEDCSFVIGSRSFYLHIINKKKLNLDFLKQEALNGSRHAAYILLLYGTNINDFSTLSHSGRPYTALMTAIKNRNINMVKWLMANNANVNAQPNHMLETALMIADDIHIIKTLLNHPEINVDLKYICGKNVLDLAIDEAKQWGEINIADDPTKIKKNKILQFLSTHPKIKHLVQSATSKVKTKIKENLNSSLNILKLLFKDNRTDENAEVIALLNILVQKLK